MMNPVSGSVYASPACVAQLALDRPISDQYLAFLSAYAHGDLGSGAAGGSVSAIILHGLPLTVLLVATSFFFQQLIALPLGIYAAVRRYSAFDGIFTFVSYLGLSVPAFILGIALIYLFAVHWPLAPAGRATDITLPVFWTRDWFAALATNPLVVLGDLSRHLVLPAFTLMVVGIAVDSRFMRAAMLHVLHEDYIRTAKAKGLRSRTVLFKHAFRNALLPIITNFGLYLPSLVGGAVVVETVFNWDGLGYAFASAIRTDDLATLQALLLLSSLAVLLANLLADLAYGWADPRIRYE